MLNFFTENCEEFVDVDVLCDELDTVSNVWTVCDVWMTHMGLLMIVVAEPCR